MSKLAVLSYGQRHGDRRQKISIAVIQFASSSVEHAVDNQVGLEVLHEFSGGNGRNIVAKVV